MDKVEAGRAGGLAASAATKLRFSEARNAYQENPKRCLVCSEAIEFSLRLKNKFCSQRCAGTYTGAMFVKRTRTAPRCSVCDRLTVNGDSLCRKHELENRIESGEVSDRPALRNYLISSRGHKCEVCFGTEWLGGPIPLELDHSNGDASNDRPSNLRMLCPNCHAVQPTSKGKNKGYGRKARGIIVVRM